MAVPSKNYHLAIATIVAVSTIAIAAVAQADPNPYVRDNLTNSKKTASTPTESLDATKQIQQKKIKVVQPGQLNQPGKLNQTGATGEPYVKQGPIFVKDGSQLPGNNKVTQPGTLNQTGKDGGGVFVKEGPIFVKDGSKLPVNNKVIQSGAAKSNLKSFPSAVDIEKEIRSTDR